MSERSGRSTRAISSPDLIMRLAAAKRSGKALSWLNLHFLMMRVRSAQLLESSFFGTRCRATGRLPARLGQHAVVRSRHPGRYPKLASPTLSHPAFEPLTEHHALSTGLFDRGGCFDRYPRGQDDVVSVPSGTTSQSELRASDRFDFTSSGTPTPSRISSGIMRSPMRCRPRLLLRASSASGLASSA